MDININDKAPEFTLPDQNGDEGLAERLSGEVCGALFLSAGRYSGMHD